MRIPARATVCTFQFVMEGLSQALGSPDSEGVTPTQPEQDELDPPSPVPRRLERQAAKEPIGSKRARAYVEAALQDVLDEGSVEEEPDLKRYFDRYCTDAHRRVALCRAYASYVAAQLGTQRRRSRKSVTFAPGDEEF